MRRALIFFTFSLLILLALPVEARKKKPSKYDQKRENAYTIPLIEPDPISRKTKPDTGARPLEQPVFALLGRQGKHYRGSGSGIYTHGIDVSHYQGRIDWSEVAHDPDVEYVYLKATEGANNIDDTYAYNLREARRHGLKTGSYHFFRAQVSPDIQFRNFMSVVDVAKQDLLPIIDVEAINRVSMPIFHSRLERLLQLVTQAFGRKPIIYTGKNFYNKHLRGPRYSGYPFMIAAYTPEEPELNNNDDYLIWQYSATGRVRGIRGNVDQSRFVGYHNLQEILLK